MTHKKTALLLGAYGQTNLGDDLLLANYTGLLTELDFKKIYINASKADFVPESITSSFDNIEIFETYHTSPFKIFSLLRKVDYVFYGGGTVYKELYASTGRSKYSVILGVMAFNVCAKLMRKKVYGLHIGIGSIKTWLGKSLVKIALASSRHTTFRDKESYDYARNILGVAPQKISHSTDGLFIDSRWRDTDKTKHTGMRVGLNVLSDVPDWVNRHHYLQCIQRFANYLMTQNCTVVFLPFQNNFNPHNDLVFTNKHVVPYLQYKDYEVVTNLTIDTIIPTLEKIDVLVGMRFHLMMLATTTNTPLLGLAYDTKCWRFLQEESYPFGIRIEDLSYDELVAQYTSLTKDITRSKKLLARISEKNYKKAGSWKKQLQL